MLKDGRVRMRAGESLTQAGRKGKADGRIMLLWVDYTLCPKLCVAVLVGGTYIIFHESVVQSFMTLGRSRMVRRHWSNSAACMAELAALGSRADAQGLKPATLVFFYFTFCCTSGMCSRLECSRKHNFYKIIYG